MLDLSEPPAVVLFIGVNGVGKTTTIGKLAARLKDEGKKVLLCAGDTFRAAAAEQLKAPAETPRRYNKSGLLPQRRRRPAPSAPPWKSWRL